MYSPPYLANDQIYVVLSPIFGAHNALLLARLFIHHRLAATTAKTLLGISGPMLYILLIFFLREAIRTIITGAVHTKTANEKTFRNLGEWRIKLSQSTSAVTHLTVQTVSYTHLTLPTKA